MIAWSAHLSTLFPEVAPAERPAAAAAAGFHWVETWWPPLPTVEAFVETVTMAGVRAACVNADGGDLAAGDRGFCNHPARAEDVVRGVEAAVLAARSMGGGTVNLLVGRDDGVRSLAEQRAVARETVRAAAVAADRLGGRLVVEHLNPLDVDRPLLPTPADAVAFVESVGHAAVSVLFDAYHAARAGLQPVEELARVEGLLGHVQYADAPGRGAPGTGTVDLEALVVALDAMGYTGCIGLEFAPQGPTPAALAVLRTLGPAAPFPAP